MKTLPELNYCISFYQIVTPNNKPLSPKLQTYQQALDLLGTVLDLTARITRQTVFYSRVDEDGRHDLLAEIVDIPVEAVENQLVDLSLKISGIAEKNKQYTYGLASRILKLKKPIELLTVFELVEQINLATKSYNAVFGSEL